jgi:hypothetical protein
MTGRCRPGLFKHLRDFASRHRAAIEVHRDQNAPSDRVSQCREHRFIGVRPFLGFVSLHESLFSMYAK